MPRLPRYVVPGQPQHVIQRGNNRSAMFAVDEDYVVFRRILRAACEQHECAVHAYVLMTNHVHLVITPHTANGIARVMQYVGRRYVPYFNLAYQRTGALWEGRYRASLIDSERYLLSCYRYVELNPVRSGQVSEPGTYRWSSYRTNALGESDPMVSQHHTYVALGADTRSRCTAYRALFLAPLTTPTLTEIRQAAHRGWPLGTEQFRQTVTMLLKRGADRSSKGPDSRSEVFQLAGSSEGIQPINRG